MSSDHRLRSIGTSHCATIQTLEIVVCLFLTGISLGCGSGSTSITNSNGGGGGAVAAKVTGTISAGTNPTAIAVDFTNNKIYVANFGRDPNNGMCQTCYCPGVNGTLTVIDGATQVPTTSGFSYAYQNPFDLGVNSANHNLYVVSRVFPDTSNPTCGYAGELDEINTTTSGQINTSFVGHAVAGERIAVNQNTGNEYVTDWYDGTLTVLDASGNVLGPIALGARPIGLGVNATTNRIYVANGSGITVIDGTTSSIIDTITDPNIVAPIAVAVNSTTNTIYVANGQSCDTCPSPNDLAVIDGASGSVTGVIPLGASPGAMAVDTQTNFIYVVSGGKVTVINGATNTTTALTDPNAKNPVAIATNSVANKIYVANSGSNNVTVIDGAHN